ncbi:Uncharacterised protein [Mycobacteroides abscessus subsp. abscessus]|uniref:DUF6197 family protein n=1 Tax=Mycobacteroides abscessus TaxID=36809 RepID=UPI000926C873|nr:hypothetical protein [Mycobacteroides abscessus]SIL99928.1 Uncharacterised protein [Mycobacteroides abscessus subsp. abscessus]
MSAPITAADVLRSALVELRRPLNEDGNGWAQHQFGSGDRCKCAIGAIESAVITLTGDDAPHAQAPYFEARSILAQTITGADDDPRDWSIISWNDYPNRTFAEVETVFERAIELAEAGAR